MIINEFINLLENYKEKLKVVPYNYENYSCELSCLFANRKKLISNQIKKEHFINFCKNMFKNEVFKLAHPIHNNVEVYAVKDYHYYIQHFIFMIDKDNKYPLLICQAYDFCQFFITTEYIYFNPLSDKWIIDSNQSQCFPYLKSIVKDMKNDINHLYFTQKKYGFYLSDHRPIHYFVETLSSLYILDIFKNTTKNSFYFPKKYKDNFSSDVDVYISPKIFSYVQNIFNDVLDESIIKLNNEILNNEDNDGFIFLDKFKYDLVVWIGIPGDRREWIGWLDGIYNILFNLFQYYDFIKVYFDGMTAFDGLKGEYYENNLKFYKLYEKISILNNSFKGKKQCKLISLIGYDYKTKVKCCSTCDIVLTECSTTMLTPIILCKKPGVVFYNGEEGFKNNALIWMKHKHQKLISEKFVLNNGGSYYISWEHMYNLFLMILIEIKKIESFDIAFKYIPSMEFVVDRYGPSTNFENNQLCLYT
ncbi:TPA: hypothetical protein RZK32_001585, partial [Campylobacter coli]|nr:hypothetical protein [Campylobacter coli]